MKRVTWTILILLLCTILTLTACMGPADPAEESSQLLSSEAVPQTETEMTSFTRVISIWIPNLQKTLQR